MAEKPDPNDPPAWVSMFVPMPEHLAALRAAQERFEAERDRRYADVATEREKAVKIKEEADEKALGLQRDFQRERDTKANELREQIGSERGLYATKGDLAAAIEKLEAANIAGIEKIEAVIKPITDYITQARGQQVGKERFETQHVEKREAFRGNTAMLIGIAAFVLSVVVILSNYFTSQ